MEPFAHLHLHTEYSLLDGAARIGKLFPLCYELGIPAVAITDHGNMFGAFEFVKAAVRFTDEKAEVFDFLKEGREFKVKPIIGCEVYMCDDMHQRGDGGGRMPKFNHLILLCKNETGYKNLIKMVSLAYTEGLYYKPRIDFELLKLHTEGLICLSACLAGAIPQALLAGDYAKADGLVKRFVGLFGEDFYIEIQDHNIRDQKAVLPGLVRLARENGVKLVATNDVHYLRKKDAAMQKVLQCISFRNTMVYEEPADDDAVDVQGEGITDDGYFPTKEFYLKSYAQMQEVFPGLEEALTNTLEVAAKCRCDFFRKEPLMPSYVPEDGSKPYDYLRRMCFEGLERKYGEITPEIRERAEYELGIISRLGFVDYFLIVWDFIHWSETQGIPVGPGRGSGVGSIVAYAIGITKVEPLQYSLIFERFLNPERVSNPDFDIDFCVDRREEVIQYVTRKYGKDNVSQIVTFGTMAAKAAVKDVARVYNHPFSEVNKITKLFPAMMGKKHIENLLGKPMKDGTDVSIQELKDLYNGDDMLRHIMDMAMEIEGMPRQTGMHAAGVIICRDPISDHVPMAKNGDGYITTQFNMIECEELGLLKMDFLGLTTLTDIKKAVDIIKKTRGIELDFYSMKYDDPGVFQLISEGDTHAVFQLESEGIKKFMRDLRPGNLEDVIAGISLYRPGPMDKIGEYVHNKKHPESIKYAHPLLEPILKVTYGIMVYQEQVMQIVQELAGYSLGRADNVRRMMAKKKHEAMEKEREVFLHGTVDNKGVTVDGCIKRGVPEDVANKIYDDMISFASYAFNKSHAAAYAYLSYQTAYLKRYYTVEFIAAVLNNRITKIDEIRNYLSYLKERGIAVLPPNINKSFTEFTVEDGAVRIGMAAIKNVGAAIIGEIVAEREKNGPFREFHEFVQRMSHVTLNKKMLESLIYAGTFDCFGHPRAQLMQVYEQVLDRTAADRKVKESGQFSFFDAPGMEVRDEFVYPDVREYPLAEKLRMEKEVSGVYLTGHPLDEYTARLKTYEVNTSMFRSEEDDSKDDSDKDDGVKDDQEEQTEDRGLKDGAQVTVGGMLIEAGRKFTKQNKELGVGKLEDLYGTVDLVVFGYKLAAIKKHWEKDTLVTVSGRLRVNDMGCSIWVDSVEPWKKEEIASAPSRKMCFYISFKNDDESLVDRISAILGVYPGSDKTYVKNTDDNQTYAMNIGVEITPALINELHGVIPPDRIRIV